MRCPSCDRDNIQGDDFCSNCGMDLAGVDIKAWGVGTNDPLLNMLLSELAIKEAVSVRPEAAVAEAIALMNERREGCAYVTDDDGKLVGVITERDVVTRVAGRKRTPEDLSVGEIMTRSPFSLRRNDCLRFALNRMGVDGFRHLAIVDDEGRLSGFFSARTVLKVLASGTAG